MKITSHFEAGVYPIALILYVGVGSSIHIWCDTSEHTGRYELALGQPTGALFR